MLRARTERNCIMTTSPKTVTAGFGALVLVSILAACGGGGGGGNPIPPGGGGSPTPATTTPPPPPPPSTTTASGLVVDDASNSPLAGVPVALMPWTPSATPFPVATTNAQGQFSFTAPNGHYLLIIGSNSSTDTRATVHDNVTLTGGAQPLVAPTEWPEPTITPPASEKSGNYRLMTLNTTVQTPCLQAVNQQRATLGLQPVVPDEWLEENSYEANQAQNNTNMTIFANDTEVTIHTDQDNGEYSCADWEASQLPPAPSGIWSGYQMLSSPYALWYGGAFTVSPNGANHNVGWEEWGYDPRIDTACPSPAPNPAPTPGPGGCDPVYVPWP